MIQIRTVIADYEKLGIDRNWERLMKLLPEEDREKALRFKQEPDRIRSVTGACLILAHVKQAFPGRDVRISRTEHGKPYVEDRTGFHFNLSHSGRLIAYAEDTVPVGIDVERVKEKNWRIFHRYLSKEEYKMIEGSEDPESCFFKVWTVREAFAKEEGPGLAIFDDEFSIDHETKTIRYGDKTLFFRSFEHVADCAYRISICSPHELEQEGLHELTMQEWESLIGVISDIR